MKIHILRFYPDIKFHTNSLKKNAYHTLVINKYYLCIDKFKRRTTHLRNVDSKRRKKNSYCSFVYV